MKILIDPLQATDAGTTASLPVHLKKHVAPWAEATYKLYDFGAILQQELKTPQFSVFVYRFFIDKPVTLYPHSDKPVIALHYTLQGSFPVVLNGFGKIVLEKTRYDMFYLPTGNIEAAFEPGEYELMQIELSPFYLKTIARKYPHLQALVDKVESASNAGQPLIRERMNKNIQTLFREIRYSEVDGASFDLAINSAIYKLLYYYEKDTAKTTSGQAVSNPLQYDKIISEIHEYIAEEPHVQHCHISSLSKRFHINQNTLKKNFKHKYNIPISRYVQNQCMSKAKALLQKHTESIGDIALQLGYGESGNFTRAFKKYFHSAPTEFQKVLKHQQLESVG
ncbi:AraC family transcriptional regulator [Deminuibacter soli]|uniref:AraC family transcriptional regulator n=1 Tax=Deminuibacter soli TaxID=2291815 RepID=A0A3E1NE56_9BACT|nr:AraC family transcriptional regulator [Deminuibacter soli]RFM26240.1 AraC family transcriptional regulator [Deminuibacter soli]